MENEIMNNVANEVIEVNEAAMVEVSNKPNAGVVAVVVTGLAAAGFAAYKFGKKLWDKRKAKNTKATIEVNLADEPDETLIGEVSE